MIVTGDVTQVDLDGGKRSGLRTIRRVLRDINGIAFIELTGADVVRHRIVAAIVEAYRQYEEKRKGQDA
jgi:phosphate starvation-inducible PhoH-like protein